jgi:hypothetical protein
MQSSVTDADMASKVSTFVRVTGEEQRNDIIRAAAIFMEAFTSQDGEVSAGAAVDTLQDMFQTPFFSDLEQGKEHMMLAFRFLFPWMAEKTWLTWTSASFRVQGSDIISHLANPEQEYQKFQKNRHALVATITGVEDPFTLASRIHQTTQNLLRRK